MLAARPARLIDGPAGAGPHATRAPPRGKIPTHTHRRAQRDSSSDSSTSSDGGTRHQVPWAHATHNPLHVTLPRPPPNHHHHHPSVGSVKQQPAPAGAAACHAPGRRQTAAGCGRPLSSLSAAACALPGAPTLPVRLKRAARHHAAAPRTHTAHTGPHRPSQKHPPRRHLLVGVGGGGGAGAAPAPPAASRARPRTPARSRALPHGPHTRPTDSLTSTGARRRSRGAHARHAHTGPQRTRTARTARPPPRFPRRAPDEGRTHTRGGHGRHRPASCRCAVHDAHSARAHAHARQHERAPPFCVAHTTRTHSVRGTPRLPHTHTRPRRWRRRRRERAPPRRAAERDARVRTGHGCLCLPTPRTGAAPSRWRTRKARNAAARVGALTRASWPAGRWPPAPPCRRRRRCTCR